MKKENAIFILESIDNYLKRQNDYSERDHDAIMMAIEALKQEIPKWIPCSERLPDEADYYFITHKYIDDEETEMDYWDGKEWQTTKPEYVLAWMPLPEPYKGEGDEK